MNSKQRRQKLTLFMKSGNKVEACKFLWNTVYSIYCNQQYNHGRNPEHIDWFRTLTNERLEILADKDNYADSVLASILRDAQTVLDERIDNQLGLVTES